MRLDVQWTEPDFTEISLNMEVTAYVRTDDESNPHAAMRGEEDMRGEEAESVSTRH